MDTRLTLLERMTFVGVSDSGHEVRIDTDLDAGGGDTAARPIELLGMSLGACTGMDVVSILRKKKQDVTAFEVQLHFERAEQYPKVFTSAVVTYEVSGNMVEEAAVLRAIELSASKYCPAYAMLSKVFPIELRYKISDSQGNLLLQGRWEPAFA